VDNFPEFKDYIAEFCRHAQKTFLNLKTHPTSDMDVYFSLYSKVADRVYGENGWKKAYGEVISLGGDPLPVAKKIAQGMEKHNIFY
jgi:hypothetical protein